ncbi:MAG: LacI family transcriptional regulator [Faecalibacterium sp.]|nr:LacI family transcriptional regulator [Faecalibacterium sp.]
MITIKEISDKIHVSPTTVSNVIHGKTTEVSPETVKKVEAAIQRYHYVPNMSARTLAQNSSRIIAAVIKYDRDKGNVFKDPFEGELLGGLEAGIRAAGYFMLVSAVYSVEDTLHLMATWNVDGIILCGFRREDYLKIRHETLRPMVFIDSYFGNLRPPCTNIGLNDRGAARQMTEYLIGKGHREIAFLADNRIGVDDERWQGCREALSAAGLPCTERQFVLLPTDHAQLSAALTQLLPRLKQYTALFFASDYYAVRGSNFLQDHGFSVPEDMSVAGFDDNLLGRHTRPRLTTMRQDPTRKGRLACEMLVHILRHEAAPGEQIQLEAQLVERSTVAAPRTKPLPE